jgi:CheY-like chemotaxis protein
MNAVEFRARRVLVVEDEAMVAMLLEAMLEDLGHEVAAITGKTSEAAILAREAPIDLAVLDVNLNGEFTYEIAALLRTRGIPFLFATGYGNAGLAPEWRDVPTLQKPFQLRELRERIEEVVRPT